MIDREAAQLRTVVKRLQAESALNVQFAQTPEQRAEFSKMLEETVETYERLSNSVCDNIERIRALRQPAPPEPPASEPPPRSAVIVELFPKQPRLH